MFVSLDLYRLLYAGVKDRTFDNYSFVLRLYRQKADHVILFTFVRWDLYKINSCELSDGCSKHMIYRAGNGVYGRIWLSKTKLKTCISHRWENVNISIDWRSICVHAIWPRLVTRQIHEARQVVIQFLNVVFKRYPSTYCLMQGSCFICSNF